MSEMSSLTVGLNRCLSLWFLRGFCKSSTTATLSTVMVIFLLLTDHLCPVISLTSHPVISDFSPFQQIIFRDLNNNQPYFHYMNFDPNNSSRLYIGGLDFVYRLNAENISLASKRSVNITSVANYSTILINSVESCRSPYAQKSRPDYQCRSHIRAILPNTRELYVCATGAYNPQDFYLNVETLEVVEVTYSDVFGGSGITKCPRDPDSQYTVLRVDEGRGTPNNLSAIYASLPDDSLTDYAIYRSDLKVNRTSPIAFYSLRTENGVNFDKGLTFVASFEIDQYVYFFYREIARESSNCGTIRYSRVARVCKNDLGGKLQRNQFMTFVKARLNCSVGGGDIPVFFNELYDVQYDSTNRHFYGLFMGSQDRSWGSAVCKFSYMTISQKFDRDRFYSQDTPDSQWTVSPDDSVPTPRPSVCSSADTTSLPFTTQSFALSHPLMNGTVDQMTVGPLYFTRIIAYSHLVVDTVQGAGGNFTVMCLYSDQLPDEITRVVIWNTSGKEVMSRIFSTLKPFMGNISPLWEMSLHKVSGTSWLYIVRDTAVFQLSMNVCSQYTLCSDCVQDPYCGWNSSTHTCSSYAPGLIQDVSNPSPLSVCNNNCKILNRNTQFCIPGLSLHLNCLSYCSPESGVTWTIPNRASIQSNSSDPNFVLTQNNSLVVLNTTKDMAGTFRCISNGVVLAEHNVTTSSCSYSDDIRSTFFNEYKNWCYAFDQYRAHYEEWLQQLTAKKNCTCP